MFQLLLRTKKQPTAPWLWSCVVVRPLVSDTEIVMEDELIEAVIESLDGATNPVRAIEAAGGEVGSLYIEAPTVLMVYGETLTNLFVPVAILPADDAYLVCDEMTAFEGNDRKFRVVELPQTVNYPKLAYALASQTPMVKWWQEIY